MYIYIYIYICVCKGKLAVGNLLVLFSNLKAPRAGWLKVPCAPK